MSTFWEEGFSLTRLNLDHKDSRWIADKMNNSIATHDGMTFNRYTIIKVCRQNIFAMLTSTV